MHESEGDHVRTCHGRHAARMCSLLSRAAWASLCTQIVPLVGQGAEFAAPAAAEHVLLLQKEQAAWDGASCKHHSHQSWGCRARVASADATSKHQYPRVNRLCAMCMQARVCPPLHMLFRPTLS